MTPKFYVSHGLKNSALISRLTFFKEERELSIRLKFNDEIKVGFDTNYFFYSTFIYKTETSTKKLLNRSIL